MTFLGDEGRDVLIVRRMIVDGKWTLLGPTASVGGFFMGPIYYYFMAPFLWLWNFNPVGPAIMVALFGIATIYLVYYVGKRIFGSEVGLVASCLYALSPLVIAYSRSSWNPNIVPFFGILLFFFLWDVIVNNHWKHVFWIGIILGIGLQLHYTFLALFGVVCVWFLLYGKDHSRIKHYVFGCIGFFVGFSPFLAFEVRHGFINIRSILSFVFEGKDTGFSIGHFFTNSIDVYFRLFGRLVVRVPEKGTLGNLPFIEKTLLIDSTWILALSALLLVIGIFLYKKYFTQLFVLQGKRKDELYYGITLITLWTLVILSFFGFYKKANYDYYFGMMYFVPFILIGLLFKTLYYKGIRWKVFGFITVGLLVIYNWQGMPFRYTPNNQLGQVELIAREIIDKTDGKPFNFALITDGNSDHSYRYFFELWGKSPVIIENATIDPTRKTVTDQLLIVCEDIFCKPLGNSLWEVAGFGRAEIVKQWDVSVVKLYKLVHYKGEGTSP
jgi:4-amino-4-deoxy-L-arabinose transferase-like glycosyltransferase